MHIKLLLQTTTSKPQKPQLEQRGTPDWPVPVKCTIWPLKITGWWVQTRTQIRKGSFGSHTCFGTEAEAFVHIVILSRGAPAVAVVPAGCGATLILLALKGEGEFTRCPLSVPTQGEEHCETKVRKHKSIIYDFVTGKSELWSENETQARSSD